MSDAPLFADECECVRFTVSGNPVPQGSKTLGRAKSGAAFIRDANAKKLHPWRKTVARRAFAEWRHGVQRGPMGVHLTFVLERKKTVRRPLPTVKPDLDKLVRAILDALTGIVWHDDSAVVELFARKDYGEKPGVIIEVGAIE